MLEYETLTGDEINQLMKDGKIDRTDQPSGPSVVQSSTGAAVPKAGKKFGGKKDRLHKALKFVTC